MFWEIDICICTTVKRRSSVNDISFAGLKYAVQVQPQILLTICCVGINCVLPTHIYNENLYECSIVSFRM